MSRLYYTAPPQEIFDEVKNVAILMYSKMGTKNYRKEKIDNIKRLENITDNVMYIVAQFDTQNMSILASRLSPAAKMEIRIRMLDGGAIAEAMMFRI